VTAPSGVRAGNITDLPFTMEVDRHVRGAAHGDDIKAMLRMGRLLLVAQERGYAVYGTDGEVRIVAAYDEAGARAVLEAVLARAGEREISVNWISGPQQWAIRTCVEARMELRTDIGAIMAGGDVGPFFPYLPSGAYL
jgi:hypothetical protein